MSSSAVRITLICLTALFVIAVGAMAEDELVLTRDDCSSTGARCIRDCNGRGDGDYQSCRGCSIYASCANGRLIDRRPCAFHDPPLQWDDLSKRCEFHSRTCICYRPDDFVKVSDIVAMSQESDENESNQEKLIWARIRKNQ